jgi:hypothetical protein
MNEKPLPTHASRADEREEAVASGIATNVAAEVAGEPRAPGPAPTPVEPLPVTFTRVSHEALFADPGPRCDVCDVPLDEDESDEEDGIGGRGLYVWIRAGRTVFEEVPLCAACGTAIGMSALARWDIEEEEG